MPIFPCKNIVSLIFWHKMYLHFFGWVGKYGPTISLLHCTAFFGPLFVSALALSPMNVQFRDASQ